jgi:hypothetical protein
MLAANRANAQKCTGPRTERGKARVALNALKHGKHAIGLREKLAKMGDSEGEAQFKWFRNQIARAFGVNNSKDRDWAEIERMAAELWCAARQMQKLGRMPETKTVGAPKAKPESTVFSGNAGAQTRLPDRSPVRIRLRVRSNRHGVGLVFWMQRRKFWTLKRRLLLAEGKPMEPTRSWRKPLRAADIKSGGEFGDLRPSELESRWRKRKFRLWHRGLEEPITIEQERRIRWRKRLD